MPSTMSIPVNSKQQLSQSKEFPTTYWYEQSAVFYLEFELSCMSFFLGSWANLPWPHVPAEHFSRCPVAGCRDTRLWPQGMSGTKEGTDAPNQVTGSTWHRFHVILVQTAPYNNGGFPNGLCMPGAQHTAGTVRVSVGQSSGS